MFIFKPPGIGGEVGWHQDSTFIHTRPLSTVGFHKFGLMKHGNDYVDTLVNICSKSMRYSATDLVEEKTKEIIEKHNVLEYS